MLSAICFNLDQSKILSSGNGLTLYQTIPGCNDHFENNVGKGKNAGYQHFLFLPYCFLLS